MAAACIQIDPELASILEEVYNTERQLLYAACTRARDHSLITGVDPASEYLDDLRKKFHHRQ